MARLVWCWAGSRICRPGVTWNQGYGRVGEQFHAVLGAEPVGSQDRQLLTPR